MVKEHDQVKEWLNWYTKTSTELVAGKSFEPQLNKLPDEEKNQGDQGLRVKYLSSDSYYRRADNSENTSVIWKCIDCGKPLMFEEKWVCVGKETRDFEHSKTTNNNSVRVS